jgi:hypothetical protein
VFYENSNDRFRFAEFPLWPGDYDFVAGFVVHVSGSSFRVLNFIQVWWCPRVDGVCCFWFWS